MLSTDPSSRARSLQRRWLGDGTANLIGSLFMAGLLIFCWFARGPDHPVYGLLVVSWSLVLGTVVAVPVMLRLPARWFRVPAREFILHRMLGVCVFGWMLDLSGWNRHLALPMRGFNGTRAGLRSLELSVRASICGHGVPFVIHLLLSAIALFTGHRRGALWILLPGVIFHFYPLLLQRSIMLRLQPLLDRSGSQVHKGARRSRCR